MRLAQWTIGELCNRLGVDVAEVIGDKLRRPSRLTEARSLAALALFRSLPLSNLEIYRLLGFESHSAVRRSVRAGERRYRQCRRCRRAVNEAVSLAHSWRRCVRTAWLDIDLGATA